MNDYQTGDRVQVNISAGIAPGADPEPDWRTGTVLGRLQNGMYRISLDDPIGGQQAEKEALPEHIRATGS